MKYALEEAEKLGSRVVLMGNELDQLTWDRFYHETRNTVLTTLRSFWKLPQTYYIEIHEHNAQLRTHGPLKYVESVCDQIQMNWFVSTAGQLFPEYKRLLIDKKEEDLFKIIMQNKGKVSIFAKIFIFLETFLSF